jgi:hypothetical protein
VNTKKLRNLDVQKYYISRMLKWNQVLEDRILTHSTFVVVFSLLFLSGGTNIVSISMGPTLIKDLPTSTSVRAYFNGRAVRNSLAKDSLMVLNGGP